MANASTNNFSILGNALNNKINPSPLASLKTQTSTPAYLPQSPAPAAPAQPNINFASMLGATPAFAAPAKGSSPVPGQQTIGYTPPPANQGGNYTPTGSNYGSGYILHNPADTSYQPPQTYGGATGNSSQNPNQPDIGRTTDPLAPTSAPRNNVSSIDPNNPSYGGLIQQAIQAQNAYKNYQQGVSQGLENITEKPIAMEFQTGQQAALQRNTGIQSQALANQAATAVQAAGLAKPEAVSYGSQYLSPVTGQPIGGGGGSLNDAVSNVVQRLQAGTMSYKDAQEALSGYGQGGINALQKALPQGFNVSQSNTLAGQQGSIGPAYSFAKTALSTLQDTIKNLGPGQGTNIPAVNSIGDWISRNFGIGSEQTRQYQGAVQEARNAYAQLLAASRGGTPTEYTDQARTAIPDDPTPNDISAAVANLETLGQAKLGIYGNPGQSSTGGGSTGGGIFNW